MHIILLCWLAWCSIWYKYIILHIVWLEHKNSAIWHMAELWTKVNPLIKCYNSPNRYKILIFYCWYHFSFPDTAGFLKTGLLPLYIYGFCSWTLGPLHKTFSFFKVQIKTAILNFKNIFCMYSRGHISLPTVILSSFSFMMLKTS